MAYTNFTNCTANEYKEIIYSQDDKNRIRIWFNNVEVEDAGEYCVSLTGTNRILPDGNGKRFALDNFVSKEYTLTLRDLPSNVVIADQVKISIGTLVDSENDTYEDVPIGVFNIQDTPTTDSNKINIKLRDNRVKFDFNYNAEPLIQRLGGSATLGQILNDICTQAGVTNNVGNFDGDDIEVSIFDNTITGTAYVSYILEQGGYIPTIDRLGNLIKIDISNLVTHRIPLSLVESYEIGTPFEIQRIVYESGIIKYETSSDETLTTLYLDSANPYITEQGQIDNIFSKLEGFKIDSVSTGRILGNPAIDPYDLIEIYDDEYLPSEYTQVEYLEGSGTSTGPYINTGIEATPKFHFEAHLDILSNSSYTCGFVMVGSYVYNGLYRKQLEYNYHGAINANKSNFTIKQKIEDEKLKVVIENSDSTIQTAEYDIGTPTGNNGTFHIFRSPSRDPQYMRVYYFKIYNENGLVRDYIPCYRKSDNVAGLYDLVTKEFYTNAGSGTFTYGEKTYPIVFKTFANNSYTFNGVHRHTFNTEIGLEERTENVSKNSQEAFRKYARTNIDNLEGQIQLAAGNINSLEQRVNSAELTLDSQGARLDIATTNIDPLTGDITSLKTTSYELSEEGFIIDDGSGYKSIKNTTGDYYYDNDTMIGKYTKDGSVQKDFALFGRYYYGIDENLDVENFTKDDAMFVAQLYEDSDGEQGFGHFSNQ